MTMTGTLDHQQSFSSRMRRLWWRRIRPGWLKIQWPLIWLLAVVALTLGYVGFRIYYGPTRSGLDIIYYSIQLFVSESGGVAPPLPWQLEVARFLAPAVTIYTATKAFLTIFQDQLVGLRLWKYRNHIVIAGLGQRGLLLATMFQKQGRRTVVLEANEQNKRIESSRASGSVVLIGDATDPALLKKARVQRAAYLICVLADDGSNAEVAGQARELARGRRDLGLTCLIHIVEPQLRNLLTRRELATNTDSSFRLEFFNIFQLGARALLQNYSPFAKDPERACHLLIVGLGRMGQSLIAYAASEWLQSNFKKFGKLRITVVDREAQEKVAALLFRHPQVNVLAEIHLQQVDVFSTEFQRGDFLFSSNGQCDISHAYVCLDNDGASLYTGLSLLRRLQDHRVSLVVRMTHDAGLATLLRQPVADSGSYGKLQSFNLLDQTLTPSILPSGTIETLAIAIHNRYLEQQTGAGATVETNPSLVPWDELSENLRESNRRQAQHISTKLDAIGCRIDETRDGRPDEFAFTPEELETLAELEHERWMENYLRDGWKYASGPKNLEKRTSPHLRPWAELPEDVRELDRHAVRNIPELLATVGFRVERKGN